jgi:hypothetical protein
MDEDVLKLAASFLGGSGFVALLNFTKWLAERWLKHRRSKQEQHIPTMLAQVHEVYSSMHALLRMLPCDRVVVTLLENGGDVPALGKPLYATISYEVFTSSLPSEKENWYRRQIDEVYLEILMQVAMKGELEVDATALAPSEIKDVYTAQGVVTSRHAAIHTTQGAFFMLSMDFKEQRTLNETQKALLAAQTSRLRAVFSKHYKNRA